MRRVMFRTDKGKAIAINPKKVRCVHANYTENTNDPILQNPTATVVFKANLFYVVQGTLEEVEAKLRSQPDDRKLRDNHLGALGLLSSGAVHLSRDEDGNDLRNAIHECFEDARKLGLISSWRRVLDAFEIMP